MRLILQLTLCCTLLAAFASTAQAQSWAAKPSGTTQVLTGVWTYDATNAWAVGGNGTIVKWSGSAWQVQPTGTTEFIKDVWGTSPTNVWATATGGKLLHYNGASWSVQSLATTESLNAIWGFDANNIIVVGGAGKVFRWDGTTWNAQNSTVTQSLSAVSGVSGSDIWAVGSQGTIIRWNGTTWSAVASPTPAACKGVYAANSSAVFVTTNAGLYRYNAGIWQLETTGLSSASNVWGTGHGQVWATGDDGKVAYWNGSTWVVQTNANTKALVDVSGNALMNLWAVGIQGTILQFTPAANSMISWTFVFKPAASATLQVTVGTTAKALIEDKNLAGTVTVKLPSTYVGFKALANPGFTLSTISSPQPGGLLHNAATGNPSLDGANLLAPSFGFFVTNSRTLQFEYGGSALDPAGSFAMTSPPEGKATPVSSATGNYQGTAGIRRYDFDLATDETGKFTGVGTVEGMEAVTPGSTPTSTPDLNLSGSMTTLSGKPSGAVSGSFSGRLNSLNTNSSVTGAMNLQVPFDPAPTLSAKLVKGTTKLGPKPVTVANAPVPLPGPVGGGTRTWGYTMDIVEKSDAKGKKIKYATCVLTLPTGDKILFPQKPVTFTAKAGYTIACTNGVKLDSNGVPILVYDAKNKLLTIAKTTLNFTGLKFTKPGANWVPSAGTVKYTFLGQTGSGNVLDFGVQ